MFSFMSNTYRYFFPTTRDLIDQVFDYDLQHSFHSILSTTTNGSLILDIQAYRCQVQVPLKQVKDYGCYPAYHNNEPHQRSLETLHRTLIVKQQLKKDKIEALKAKSHQLLTHPELLSQQEAINAQNQKIQLFIACEIF